MVAFEPLEVINLILFIVPGYVALYFVNLFIDYNYKRNQLDRVIEFLLASAGCYAFTAAVLSLTFILAHALGIMEATTIFSWYDFLRPKTFEITLFTIFIIAPIAGIILGYKYFGRGYPFRHFPEGKENEYAASIYARILKKLNQGGWLTCHMKDGTIIQGKLKSYHRDEEQQQYAVGLGEAIQFHPEKKYVTDMSGDIVVIDLGNTSFIEFKK